MVGFVPMPSLSSYLPSWVPEASLQAYAPAADTAIRTVEPIRASPSAAMRLIFDCSSLQNCPHASRRAPFPDELYPLPGAANHVLRRRSDPVLGPVAAGSTPRPTGPDVAARIPCSRAWRWAQSRLGVRSVPHRRAPRASRAAEAGQLRSPAVLDALGCPPWLARFRASRAARPRRAGGSRRGRLALFQLQRVGLAGAGYACGHLLWFRI